MRATAAPSSLHPPRVSRPVLYPDPYLWFVFVSALDVMLTWAVFTLGGTEANPVAAAVYRRAGFGGMIVFKFAIVALVVAICEYVGRLDPRAGRRLSALAIGISALPIAWSLALITRHLHF